jgi:hypothetical protein
MRTIPLIVGVLSVFCVAALSTVHSQSSIGREVAIARHLQDRRRVLDTVA